MDAHFRKRYRRYSFLSSFESKNVCHGHLLSNSYYMVADESVTDLGDLVQRCVECGGEWNVTTRNGGYELRNASLVFSHQLLPNFGMTFKNGQTQLVTNMFNKKEEEGNESINNP
ncbi:hypothetical protein ACJW30_03G005400 [Castanea mollissima]